MPLPRPIRPGDLKRGVAVALALLVLLAGGAAAQDGRFDQGVLWRLDPPDGGRPSHLLGTMHVADPRVLDVPAPVLEALAASDTARSDRMGWEVWVNDWPKREPGASKPPPSSRSWVWRGFTRRL